MVINKINKYGQIRIPKQFQKKVNIQNGDLLSIYYHNNSIVVEKWDNHYNLNHFNQCILSCGRVSIPVELRRIYQIKLDEPLTMEVSNEDQKIFLKQAIAFQ